MAQPPGLEVPSAALVMRGDQAYVGVVGADDRLRFHKVVVDEDDGVTARITSGIRAGDRVAVGLGERVAEGAQVQPIVPGKQ